MTGGNIGKSNKIFDLRRLPAILAKPKMLIGIERYRFIMEKVQRVDVSLDEGFQKTYENFYTLGRYPKEFRRDYFVYMERVKEIKPSFEGGDFVIFPEIRNAGGLIFKQAGTYA